MSKYRIPVMAALTMCLIAASPVALWAGTLSSDISVTKTHAGPDPAPGEMITYTIVVTNNGPSDATGAGAVNVTDTFDATRLSGCTWFCDQAGCPTAGTPASGNISDSVELTSMASATYTATCNIDSAATGDLSNTVTVASTNTDPNMADNSATDSYTLVPISDVSVTKTDGAADSTPGTTITYTIVATNNGPSDATGAGAVNVTDTFDATRLSGCTWFCDQAGCPTAGTPASGNISDSVELTSMAAATYTATCDIDPSATGNLANTATVTTSNTDSNAGNNSATDTNTLTPSADLDITRTINPPDPQAGDPLTVTYTVTNNGPSDATGVVVTVSVDPSGLNPTTIGCAEDPNGIPTCTLGTLAAGATVMFDVELTTPGSGNLMINASVGSNASDPVTTDNVDIIDIAITPVPPVTEVPTAGETGLALLAMLLGAAALWRMRQS